MFSKGKEIIHSEDHTRNIISLSTRYTINQQEHQRQLNDRDDRIKHLTAQLAE